MEPETLVLSFNSETSLDEVNDLLKGERTDSLEQLLTELDKAETGTEASPQSLSPQRAERLRNYIKIRKLKSNPYRPIKLTITKPESTEASDKQRSTNTEHQTSIVLSKESCQAAISEHVGSNVASSPSHRRLRAPDRGSIDSNSTLLNPSLFSSLATAMKSEHDVPKKPLIRRFSNPNVVTFSPLSARLVQSKEQSPSVKIRLVKAASNSEKAEVESNQDQPSPSSFLRPPPMLSTPDYLVTSPGRICTPKSPGMRLASIDSDYLKRVTSPKNGESSPSSTGTPKSFGSVGTPKGIRAGQFIKRGSFSVFRKISECELPKIN